MTISRNDLKSLIGNAISDGEWADRDCYGDAEAVLAAFAARGLIIGERVSNDEFERTHGIAVVRVVPND